MITTVVKVAFWMGHEEDYFCEFPNMIQMYNLYSKPLMKILDQPFVFP